VYSQHIKIVIKFVNYLISGASTMVNPLSHDPKIRVTIAAAASTERKKIAKRVCEPTKELMVSLLCQ
jgi:ribosome recycling factor